MPLNCLTSDRVGKKIIKFSLICKVNGKLIFFSAVLLSIVRNHQDAEGISAQKESTGFVIVLNLSSYPGSH